MKLKFQIICFMTLNMVIWFIVSELGIDSVLWLAENNRIEVPDNIYNLFLLFQLVLFVIINIPFFIFMINHIDKPVQKILAALNRIKGGCYSGTIDFKAKNEFDEIKTAISHMADELEKAKELQKNMENQRTMLFANIAHDLKTPITTVMGYSKALSDGMVDNERKKGEYIDAIHSKSKNMNDLIDRMAEYVKLNTEESILHLEKTDIAELLRTCIADIYSEFEEKKIEMDILIPDVPVYKDVDCVEIKRVFTNLLHNVLAHNDENIKVLIKMDENGTVTVADSGGKIPENIKGQLFMPFIKGDASRKTGRGSGLGLSLSQRIMELHKGKITLLDTYPSYTKAFVVNF